MTAPHECTDFVVEPLADARASAADMRRRWSASTEAPTGVDGEDCEWSPVKAVPLRDKPLDIEKLRGMRLEVNAQSGGTKGDETPTDDACSRNNLELDAATRMHLLQGRLPMCPYSVFKIHRFRDGAPRVISLGTAGHPTCCARPCREATCMDPACEGCHICVPTGSEAPTSPPSACSSPALQNSPRAAVGAASPLGASPS
mmetsp:Transcript_67614/g.195452  ORF Transcript_67614/g.195452 Transcript_67614/m.195452 type:complete len:201 (-) Transcript_67614:79-681(-)